MRGFLADLANAVGHRVGSIRRLERHLKDLHSGFAGRRGERAARYLDKSSAVAAYLASYQIPNAARARFVLSRHGAGLGAGERALDAGAGTGAAALALASISDPDSEIVLADRSPPALDAAYELFERLFPDGPRVRRKKVDLDRGTKGLPAGPFRTVIAGHLLNELLPQRGHGPGRSLDVARALAERTDPAGALILLEPAQRIPSRALCRVRDALVVEGHRPLGPCTHAARCPVAGSRGGDWCVVDVPWQRPKLVEQVDRVLSVDRRRLTVSYAALSRSADPPGGRTFEILSEPMRAGDGFVIYLCGERGRVAAKLRAVPKPVPGRGERVSLPESARPKGRDRSGAPSIPLAPGDLRPR